MHVVLFWLAMSHNGDNARWRRLYICVCISWIQQKCVKFLNYFSLKETSNDRRFILALHLSAVHLCALLRRLSPEFNVLLFVFNGFVCWRLPQKSRAQRNRADYGGSHKHTYTIAKQNMTVPEQHNSHNFKYNAHICVHIKCRDCSFWVSSRCFSFYSFFSSSFAQFYELFAWHGPNPSVANGWLQSEHLFEGISHQKYRMIFET